MVPVGVSTPGIGAWREQWCRRTAPVGYGGVGKWYLLSGTVLLDGSYWKEQHKGGCSHHTDAVGAGREVSAVGI